MTNFDKFKTYCRKFCVQTRLAVRICLSITAITTFATQAAAQNNPQEIRLDFNDAALSQVLKSIETQSRYTFFYNTKDIPLDRNVTLSVANKDIRAALDELFRNTNVSYSIDNKSIILSARGGAQPQQASQITGRIVDKNGVPVIGATIMISGTTQGTTSGVDGTFALQSNVSPAGMILDVSFIGYKPQRISVNNRTSLSVTLEEDDQQIEAVVVTALGIKRQERAVSYNVQNISDEVFLTRDANMVNSLAGKIAGVTINASAAGVGGETKVVMRGSKSIAGSNNALYVLDGIPLPSLSLTNPGDEFTIMRENNLTGDGISNFNPDDIASMAALTGPSAAALYGSQAANGVLMLTTRSGEEGVSVNYSNNTTFMSPFLTPAFQNTYGAKDGYYASWGTKLAAKQSWTPTDFYQTGYNTSNSVGLSFGGKKSQTYVSAGVVTAEGIIPNNEYNRYNFTANHSSSFLDERMHLSVLGMYMNVNEQNMLSSGQYYNPMIPVYLMSPSDDIRKYAVYERYNASRNFPVQYWPWGSQSLQMQNPYWITNRNMFNTGKDRFLFGASLKYDVTDWLDITGRARIDYTHITAEQKNYASTLGLFAGDKGRYYNNTYTTSQRYADVLANVHKTFADGAFSLNATLGASIEDYKHRAILLGGDLTGVPNLFTLANMTTNKSQAKETINDQTQSLFATLQLGYKNMVFLDVTARNDWVTALANTSKTSMFYPSVGLSAVLTDIFKVDSRVLSFAKIRASYAEVGNAPMRWITIPTYPVPDGTPQTSTYLTSDDFKPERTKSWEVGADVRLWGNKLILNATYYSSRTYNQIFNPDISSTSTYSSLYVNAGRVDNKGVEVSAELNQNLGPVKWSSNLVYSRNRNKVLSLGNAVQTGLKTDLRTGMQYEYYGNQSEQFRAYTNILAVGQPMYVFYGYRTDGIVQSLAEGLSAGLSGDDAQPGEFKYVDIYDGDGLETVDENDMCIIGDPNPDWMASLGIDVSWRRFDFSIFFNGVFGNDVLNTKRFDQPSNMPMRWTADNPTNSYPRLNANRQTKLSDWWVEDGSFVRIQTMTLGYSIPFSKKDAARKIRLYVSADNLYTFTGFEGYDPEVGMTGIYSGGYPRLRKWTFGADFTF